VAMVYAGTVSVGRSKLSRQLVAAAEVSAK
jgi:hypothetical protein